MMSVDIPGCTRVICTVSVIVIVEFCEGLSLLKDDQKLQLFTYNTNNPPPHIHTNTIQNIRNICDVWKKYNTFYTKLHNSRRKKVIL